MLKKPIVAVILCLLIVLSATVINAHVLLDSRCEKVSEGFSAPGGIADQLSAVCTASGGFVKLAEKYGLDEFTTSDAAELCTSIRFAVGEAEPSELYDLYRILLTRVDELRTSLRLQDLSAEDAKLYDEFEAEYLAAQKAIAESNYNSSASHYLRDLGSFSCFIARICGVDLPEQFA